MIVYCIFKKKYFEDSCFQNIVVASEYGHISMYNKNNKNHFYYKL